MKQLMRIISAQTTLLFSQALISSFDRACGLQWAMMLVSTGEMSIDSVLDLHYLPDTTPVTDTESEIDYPTDIEQKYYHPTLPICSCLQLCFDKALGLPWAVTVVSNGVLRANIVLNTKHCQNLN